MVQAGVAEILYGSDGNWMQRVLPILQNPDQNYSDYANHAAASGSRPGFMHPGGGGIRHMEERDYTTSPDSPRPWTFVAVQASTGRRAAVHHRNRSFPFVLALILMLGTMLLAVVAAPGFAAPQRQQDPAPAANSNPFPPIFPNSAAMGLPRLPHPELAENNPGPMLQQNQENMKKDINQLYTMVQQLKEQSDKTNSTQVLSLGLVNKASKIEKLAKKIGKLAAAR